MKSIYKEDDTIKCLKPVALRDIAMNQNGQSKLCNISVLALSHFIFFLSIGAKYLSFDAKRV